MAEKENTSKAAVVVSVGAAIAAAYALMKNRAAGIDPSHLISLDEATMNLLLAIAQASNNVDANTLDALAKLQDIIDKIGVSGQGWPTNTKGIRAFTLPCVAVATAYRGYDMEVPDGMPLAIKAHPWNAVGSLVRVADTPADCTNINSSWPLIPNESQTYRVTNANKIYISSNVAGSIAIFSSERRV